MSRTIQSPGVQITEKDLSLRTEVNAGTNVLVPGFAAEGPACEPLYITTVSELESIYGTPKTAAEKYFYYTCREVLNSPATLTTVRLPYGENNGSDFSDSHSALFYPATLTEDGFGNKAWAIGAPSHFTLTVNEYTKLLKNDFTWLNTSDALSTADVFGLRTGGSSPIDVTAGFIILNDLQTTINEVSEGYYIGFSDNLQIASSSPNFESICNLYTLIDSFGTYGLLSDTRFDFALSATAQESSKGITSVSETLEKVGFIGFETTDYQDHLSLGVVRVRRSTIDASRLTLASSEKYLGSFDYDRKEISPNGGILTNAFIEDSINNDSPTIKMIINPAISKDFDWIEGSTVPVSRITVLDEAKALFPLGVFTPDTRSANNKKIIGNVPGKLDKALRLLEITENTTVDVIVDGGLSTVYSVANYVGTNEFNDESYIDEPSNVIFDWRAVTNTLINFSENTRRDCFTIIDPPRSIFVSGKDSKIIDMDDKTFSADIYGPLKEAASYETNFAAMYGNWVKVSDIFTGRRMWAPMSGYAAAIFARSDEAANFWAAPAGMNRGMFNVLDIALNPNQKQRDRLYEIAVNPVVFFNGDGYVIMGQKTLQSKPTAFDRINVRRLFLSLERSVQKTLKYFVFEPNTDFTRNRIKNVIAPIFELAKNTEGLYDYLIVADERNNLPDVIDRNELVVDIYIKPVRTAEFILVNFIATRTGQNFQELL